MSDSARLLLFHLFNNPRTKYSLSAYKNKIVGLHIILTNNTKQPLF